MRASKLSPFFTLAAIVVIFLSSTHLKVTPILLMNVFMTDGSINGCHFSNHQEGNMEQDLKNTLISSDQRILHLNYISLFYFHRSVQWYLCVKISNA